MAKLKSSRLKRTINELHAIYELSEEEKRKIEKLIIDQYTDGVTPESSPVIVILGGQPGSGKSELTTEALDLLKDNAVICNADDYRDFHPKAEEINRRHEKYYPEITVRYSQPWNDMLRAFCEGKRLNYILETTFSSGARMNETVVQMKNKGYSVVLMVLSVEKTKLSWHKVSVRIYV